MQKEAVMVEQGLRLSSLTQSSLIAELVNKKLLP